MRGLFPPPITLILLAMIGYLLIAERREVSAPDVSSRTTVAPKVLNNEEQDFATIVTGRKPDPNGAYAIAARPLFSSTRRDPLPPEPEVEPEPEIVEEEPEEIIAIEPPKQQLQAEFLGVLSENNSYQALLEFAGQQVWVTEGAIIEEWQITAIDDEKVTLRYKEQVFSIPIER